MDGQTDRYLGVKTKDRREGGAKREKGRCTRAEDALAGVPDRQGENGPQDRKRHKTETDNLVTDRQTASS